MIYIQSECFENYLQLQLCKIYKECDFDLILSGNIQSFIS